MLCHTHEKWFHTGIAVGCDVRVIDQVHLPLPLFRVVWDFCVPQSFVPKVSTLIIQYFISWVKFAPLAETTYFYFRKVFKGIFNHTACTRGPLPAGLNKGKVITISNRKWNKPLSWWKWNLAKYRVNDINTPCFSPFSEKCIAIGGNQRVQK